MNNTFMDSCLINHKRVRKSHLNMLFLYITKIGIFMKGMKGTETKGLIRETAFRLFLVKDFNIVPLKQIEQTLHLSRGCMSYHYPTKQALFNDVIDYYILHKQNPNNKMQCAANLTLLEFIYFYTDKVASTKKELQFFLSDDNPNNITNAYLKLISQAECYYPDFKQIAQEVKQYEVILFEKIIKNAQNRKEIKSDLDSLLLAQQFRYLFYGQSYDDALNNGLNVDKLKEQFLFLYSIIKI